MARDKLGWAALSSFKARYALATVALADRQWTVGVQSLIHFPDFDEPRAFSHLVQDLTEKICRFVLLENSY